VFGAAGWEVHYQPVLKFTFNTSKLFEYLVTRQEEFEGLIVTSPRSFEALRQLDSTTLARINEVWKYKPVFAVVR